MANLGTLMFGADIDLKKLKDSINSAKGDIEKALRITLDTNSYEEVVSRLKKLEEASQKAGKESSEAHQKSAQNAKQEADNTEKVTHLTENYRKLLADVANQMANISRIQLDGTKLGINPTVLSKVSAEYEKLWKTITNSMSGTEIFKGFPVLDMSSDQFARLRAEFNALQSEYKLVTKSANEFNKTTEKANTKAAVQAIKEQTAAAKNAEAENQKWASSMDYARSKANELKNTIEKYENAVKNAKPGIDTTALQNSIEQLKKNLQTLYGMIGGSKMNGTAQDFVSSSAFKVPLDNARHYFATLNEGRTVVTNLTEAEQRLASSIKGSTDSMRGQSQVLNDLKSMAMQYLSVWGAQSFISSIIQTGGLLEQQRMSIGAILGDLSQANHLFGQITQLALKSPFGVVQLDTMSKQLTAYNFKYSELYDWTKRLADISAATGTEVSRLALALGHVRSEGALSGYTLRQFAMGNVPLLQTLSKQLGKTTAEIRKMTREKAITYDDVEKALKTLTDEGGIFANAQEVMSNALNAKFKNLHDAFDIMFGNMAESSVGDVLKKVAETLTVLAKHWKEVGAQVIVVTGAFAAYKAVSATVNAGLLRSGVMTGQYSAKQLELLATTGKLNKQFLLQAVAAGKVSAADAEAAGAVYNLTRAQLDAVAATGKTAAAYDVAAIAGGKFATQTQILASQFKSASWFSMTKWAIGAKLAWTGLTGAFKAATTAVRGFLTTMWPLLALSAVTEVFMRMGQNAEETDKYLKDLSQTANEASKSLGELTKNYSVGSSVGKDSKQLTEDIKEMTEQLKSYSENASETFKNAFAIDSEGKSVHSLAEQYEILAKALDTAKKGYERLGEHSDIISNAIDSVDWQHGHGKIRKFLEETGSMLFGWMASDTYNANRGSLNDAIENYVNKVREVRLAENELLKDRLSITKALKAAGYQTVDMWSNDEIISVASSIPTYFKESDRAKVEGFWNAIGDSAKDALEKVKDSNAELEKAYALASSKAQAAGKAVFEALSAEYGDDMKKWPAEWRDEVMTALARVTAGVSGFADMSEEQQLRVRNAFMQPFGITLTLDNSEAEKRLTDMQIHLNELVGEDWVIKLHLETVGSFEQLYDQLDKTVKKSNETIKKLGDGFSEKDKARITSMATDINTLTDKEKEYRDAVLNRQKAITAANKEGFKLSSLEKAANKAATAAHKAETAAEKEAKAKTKMAEAQLKIDEELAKQRLELEDAIADAEVAAIKNNSARERAQRLNEMRKQERDLKKQVEEWKKTAFKALKEKYEADPNNKKVSFYDTPEGKAGWQGIPLTKEQEETYKQRWATMLATGEKSLKELVRAEHKANADAIQKYIEQFGTYEEKKKAIYEKANDEICDLQEQLTDDMTDEERQAIDDQIALVKKGAQDQVDELDVKYGKAKAILIDLFEDASEKSITEIEKIIKKYEALVKYLKGEDNVSREDLISFGFTEKEIDKIVEKIEKEGVSSIKDFTEQIKKLKGELGNRSPWMAFSVNIEKAIEKIKNAKGENKGSEIGTGLEEIGRSIQDILPSVESFGESVANMFQTNDADFRQTIQRLKDLGGLVEGIGKIASKDYFGGIMQAGQSLINIIGSFSAQKEQEKEEAKQERLERLRNSIEAANDSIQRLTEELEKSYGVEALRLEEEQKKRVAENQQRAVKGLNELGLGSLDETFNFFDNQWQSAAGAIGARYGKQFGLSWLSWTKDALDNDIIKDYADDFRLSIESIEKLSELGNQYVWYPVTGLNGSWEELLKDPEKLAKTLAYIRKFDEGLWGDLIAINDETAEWLTALADSADQWEKIELKAKEQITGTSFDSVFDSFMNGLYEFANGTEDAFDDIADNWQKMINKMVINNLVGQKVKERLKAWYEMWDAAYSDDKEIDADELKELQRLYNEIWDDTVQEVKAMAESGITKPIEESTDKAKKYFESLLDSWKSTITDMSQTTEDWKNSLIDQVFNDLVESTILNVPIDVDTTEGQKHFDDFARYIEDWTDRYKKVMEDTTLTDEQRNEKLKALIKEQTDVREAQAEKSKKIAESIGKDITEAFSNSLDSLGSTLLDGLLDTEKDAAQMGKEIGQTLVREMIQELLASEKYSGQINAIKKLWQNVLKGGGSWTDEEGLFGEKGAVYDVDKVIGKITELDDTIANDDEITALTEKYRQFGYVAESSFGNLKDTFMDAVLDMEHGAENFAKKLNETLVKDLVNKKVFGEAFTLNGKEFANFDVYQADWTERYIKALEKGDRALMEELTKELREREKVMAESAEEYAKMLQDVADDTTFKDMADDFLSAVTDMNKTAEDWGKQIGETMAKKILEGMLLKDKIMPIMEGIQKAFNDTVKKYTDAETGKIDWKAVMNEPALAEAVKSGKADFEEFRQAWKQLCKTFGLELNELPLPNIGDTVLDSLLDIEDSAEDFGKRIALDLMNEMLRTMMSREFADRIKKIRQMWQSVLDGDGQYTMQQVLDEIQGFRKAVKENKAMSDLIDGIEELSKTSEKVFSSMADSWTSTLMDMEGTAEDFVKSVGRMMAEKIIATMITPKFIQPILDEMDEVFEKATAEPGATWQSVVSAMVPFLGQMEEVYATVTPMIEEIFGSFGIFKEVAEETEEAVEEIEYALGDMKSEFSSALMDMESTAESFSKNIKNILAKTFVEKFILGDRFDAMMEQWQQQFEGILTGTMSDDQRKKSIQKLADSMTDYEQSLVGPVMSLLESLGLTAESNQEATMNMADKITYDQADQLLGINLAQELTLEQILAEIRGRGITSDVVSSVPKVYRQAAESVNYENEQNREVVNALLSVIDVTRMGSESILTQLAMANSSLSMIRDYSKKIRDEVVAHMASMDMKLNNLSRL